MTGSVQQVRALMEQGCWQDAKQRCRRLVKKSRNDAEALFLLGVIHGRLEEYEAALDCFQRVLKLSPNVPEAHQNLGLALKELRRPQEAICSFRKAVQLKPDYVAAMLNLGNTCFELGLSGEAIDMFERITGIDPDHPDLWSALGLAYVMEYRFRESINCFHKALQWRQGDGVLHEELWNNIGMSLNNLGDRDVLGLVAERP